MVIEFKWNSKVYSVLTFSVSFQSTGTTQGFGDCIPGVINVNLEIPPKASPGKDFFSFARSQHANAEKKGKGQITVFKGHDKKKEGQAIQTVTFDKAWFSDISSTVSIHNDDFNFNLNIIATEVSISGEKFVHDGRKDLFAE